MIYLRADEDIAYMASVLTPSLVDSSTAPRNEAMKCLALEFGPHCK